MCAMSRSIFCRRSCTDSGTITGLPPRKKCLAQFYTEFHRGRLPGEGFFESALVAERGDYEGYGPTW